MIMPLLLLRSVLPSGVARATASAAMTPPPPGLLSIRIVWPCVLEMWCPPRFKKESMLPPDGTEMTTRNRSCGLRPCKMRGTRDCQAPQCQSTGSKGEKLPHVRLPECLPEGDCSKKLSI